MKAFIFDMDGVIVDTEPVHAQAVLRVLEKFGVTGLDIDFMTPYRGTSDLNMWQDMKKRFNIPEEPEKLVAAKNYVFGQLIHKDGPTPIPGVLDLIERTNKLRAKGLKTAIASSSSPEFIAYVVGELGLKDKFDTFQSGAELPQSKPDPAIYLQTAAVLKVAPADCVVLEDATVGIMAAQAAGMYAIAYQSPHGAKQDLSQADEIVDDMAKVRLDF